MEINGQGDLADIFRACTAGGCNAELLMAGWQPPAEPMLLQSSAEGFADDFGDPFAHLILDPLLSELTGVELFLNGSAGRPSTASPDIMVDDVERSGGDSTGGGGGGGGLLSPKTLISHDEVIKIRTCSMISSVSQVGTAGKPAPLSLSQAFKQQPADLVADEMMMKVNDSSVARSVNHDGEIQISSSGPTSAEIKRRKSQAKKVVCIPAPAAASNRPRTAGQVVPSDLWAWRKYGQKPIKGSPYPRGYYRCSSSKGCSARKQVERSRTDPNLLVITYTSEHNHPWPTQHRNALAGSTRSLQPTMTSKIKRSGPSSSYSSSSLAYHYSKLNNYDSSSTRSVLKEESVADLESKSRHPYQYYKPFNPDQTDHHHEYFFVYDQMAELELDPISLIYSNMETAKPAGGEGDHQAGKDFNPFNMFD